MADCTCFLPRPSLFTTAFKPPCFSAPPLELKLHLSSSGSVSFEPRTSFPSFVAQSSNWAQQEEDSSTTIDGQDAEIETEEDESTWRSQESNYSDASLSDWNGEVEDEEISEPPEATELLFRGFLYDSEPSDFSATEDETMGSIDDTLADLPNGVIGEIIQIIRNVPENTKLGEFLGDYEGRLSVKESVDILLWMSTQGIVLPAFYLFQWMDSQEPSLVTPHACSVLFPFLGRAQMGDELMLLFRNLEKRKEFRDVHVYNAAIFGLLCCKRYQDSWQVYESMERNNILPDDVTFSTVITVMRKTGRSAKDVWEFSEKMNRRGVKWSREVLGAIIKSFCDEGLKNEALIIQSEMEKRGVPSDATVYNTLMDAYCKSNQIEEVEGLFSEMKMKGLRPTIGTFNILMDAYSRRMQPEIVEKLFQEMQDIGLKPNSESYSCLIAAYGRQRNRTDMAEEVFLKMKRLGIKPNSYSYIALIHAYSVGGWVEKAYTTFEDMKREGMKPSTETYNALLDAFRRAGDAKGLMQIWKMMIDDKIEKTRITFNIVLDGFSKQGQYEEARDVISEFGKIGLTPTLMTYNMLINAYARGGQNSKLPQVLKEMAAIGLKPDSVTYSTIIYAFIRARDFKRAFYYHKQMVKSGQVPDFKSYEKLRATLDVKAAKQNKKDRSAILGIINSKMGMVKAKKKGKKDEFWKNKKKRYTAPDVLQG